MANCKGCHTRIPAKAVQCPHCGQAAPQRSFRSKRASSTPQPTAPLSPSTAKRKAPEKAPSPKPVARDQEIELPLDEEVAVSQSKDLGSGAGSPNEGGAVSGRATRRSAQSQKESAGLRSTGGLPVPTPEIGLLALSADQIRHWVGEHPECVESGLVLEDPASLSQRGPFDVGEAGSFDWMARSSSGDWVALFVRSGQPGPAIVSEALQAVGWMRKHLCQGAEGARALVLLEGMPDELGYAAAAVGEMVAFRTWRVAVTFEPLNP